MKITTNKEAEKVLKGIKKELKCSDSTAILVLYAFAQYKNRR